MFWNRFTAQDSVMLLIDHQVGTMGWAKSQPFEELKRNTLMLAKTAKILGIPVVITSSMEEYAQGPLLGELETILPAEFAARIKRTGIVNAMDDENFAAAVRSSGRKKLSSRASLMMSVLSIRRCVWLSKDLRCRSSPMRVHHPLSLLMISRFVAWKKMVSR